MARLRSFVTRRSALTLAVVALAFTALWVMDPFDRVTDLHGTTALELVLKSIPPHAHDCFRAERGFQGTMVQLRFDLPTEDLAAFAASLPCVLEPVSGAPPKFANVGTNDRRWYRPQDAVQHQGCEFHGPSRWTGSVLVDESDATRPRIYLVYGD